MHERRNNLLGRVLATNANANTWHLALFDVVSGHVCFSVWFRVGPLYVCILSEGTRGRGIGAVSATPAGVAAQTCKLCTWR